MFDVLLESPQQVRRQNFVQRLHLTSLLDRAELGFEIFLIGEATSVHEVQEGPELGCVVLQRRARKQHDAPGEIQRVQVAHCASSAIFQAVRLIDHKAAPRHFGERRAVRLDHLVGRQHHVRFVHRVAVALGPVFVHQLVLADDGSGGGVPNIRHHVRAGSPSRGFAFPVHESGQGHDHERGTTRFDRGPGRRRLRAEHVVNQCERLRGFPETHLVREHAPPVREEKVVRHPAHTLPLILAENVSFSAVPLARGGMILLGNGRGCDAGGGGGDFQRAVRKHLLVPRHRIRRVRPNPLHRFPGDLIVSETAAPSNERLAAFPEHQNSNHLETLARHRHRLAGGSRVFLPKLRQALRREVERGGQRGKGHPRAMRERAGFPLDQDLDGIVVRGRGVGRGRVESGRESPPHELLCQVDVFGESAQHVNLHRGPLVSGPRCVRRDPVGRRGERVHTLGGAGGVALVVVVHGHVSEHVVPEGSVLRGGFLRVLTGTATGRLLVVR